MHSAWILVCGQLSLIRYGQGHLLPDTHREIKRERERGRVYANWKWQLCTCWQPCRTDVCSGQYDEVLECSVCITVRNRYQEKSIFNLNQNSYILNQNLLVITKKPIEIENGLILLIMFFTLFKIIQITQNSYYYQQLWIPISYLVIETILIVIRTKNS